jgi:hypothetical protein
MSCTAAKSDGHKGQVSNGLDKCCAGPLQMLKGEEIWEAEEILGEEKLSEEDERQLLELLEKIQREVEESGDQDAFYKRVIWETKQELERVCQYNERIQQELKRVEQENERLKQELDAIHARAEAGERQL